ncbi:MAG: hypothetical protein LKI53_07510 [Bacteroidales bacterium]|nr:hypothetical protein [Bacteroidales bacterium]
MKKLIIISNILLIACVITFLLLRFVFDVPDWTVRLTGILMLLFLFTTVFLNIRAKGHQDKSSE